MGNMCKGFWEEAASRMCLKGWIGFLELEEGRTPGEIPVLGNSKVMRPVREEHSVLRHEEKREKGRFWQPREGFGHGYLQA